MMSRSLRGFTLIELILVIILLGTLSISAVSRFNSHSFESASVAAELISAIRYAQEMSMVNTGQDIDGDGNADYYQVVIGAGGYSVSQNRSSDGVASAIANPVSNESPYASTWTNVSLSPVITIKFDGLGEPNISASQTISVTVGADSRNVIVEKVTGFTR
ncbi:MAG TPA: prepilin-type N-terminal cleavage/methylation domain-containing protein [Gammaproteobacteria bacterium]|nr:prepilin-type N-terminal cleavage/methylation domain-containing protein [Gammaproteobacteria bacterium]